MAVEEMKQFRLGPLFIPPSLRGTLMRPRESGGANWGGAAFAPETGFLFVRSSEGVSPNQVCKTDPPLPDVDVEYTNNCAWGACASIFRGQPHGTFLLLFNAIPFGARSVQSGDVLGR